MNELKPEDSSSILEKINEGGAAEINNIESRKKLDLKKAIEKEKGILEKFKGFTGKIAKILVLVTSLSFIPGDRSLDQRTEVDKSNESSAKAASSSPEDEDYLDEMKKTFVLTKKITSSTIRKIGDFAKEEIVKAKWEIWRKIYQEIYKNFDAASLFASRYAIINAVNNGFTKYKNKLPDGSGFVLVNYRGDEKKITVVGSVKKESGSEKEPQSKSGDKILDFDVSDYDIKEDPSEIINIQPGPDGRGLIVETEGAATIYYTPEEQQEEEKLRQMAGEDFLPAVEDLISSEKLDEVWDKIPKNSDLRREFLMLFNSRFIDSDSPPSNEQIDEVIDQILESLP